MNPSVCINNLHNNDSLSISPNNIHNISTSNLTSNLTNLNNLKQSIQINPTNNLNISKDILFPKDFVGYLINNDDLIDKKSLIKQFEIKLASSGSNTDADTNITDELSFTSDESCSSSSSFEFELQEEEIEITGDIEDVSVSEENNSSVSNYKTENLLYKYTKLKSELGKLPSISLNAISMITKTNIYSHKL